MIKIAITGPESTGKSWLAENLALHFQADWVPEYAREYLNDRQGKYNYTDILDIAKGQLLSEAEKEGEGTPMLFVDTEFSVTYIWSRVKYGEVHPWIRKQLSEHRYDLYLLCDIDLPWEYDPLREHPGMRKELFDQYYNLLSEIEVKFEVVRGAGNRRLENAVNYVNSLLSARKDTVKNRP